MDPVLHPSKFWNSFHSAPSVSITIPEGIEFLGSLAEYAASLPNVEEDWYKDAYHIFVTPKAT